MQEILKTLAQLELAPGYPYGLATVVATEGSSYRRPGARMLLDLKRNRTGAISGGCLEEDMVAHLDGVMATGSAKTLIYDTTRENDLVWGVGLGCNGKVTLLLERLEFKPDFFAFARRAADELRIGCVLATVYACVDEGLLGTRFAIAATGPGWNAGLPESWRSAVEASASAALAAGRSRSLAFDQLANRPSIFFEYIAPTPQLVILGAGDDAQPLARFAHALGWRVTVADPRSAYATSTRFPTANAVLVLPPESITGAVPLDSHTFAVVMTHHYVHDLPFLRELINQPIAYLGLLGPKKRANRLLDEIRDQGRLLTPDALDRLHAPVGLDLGGDAPEAVALSMLAEMQAVLHDRDAAPLRLRSRPIHE
jgi:xanthine/CO dehydrogenase XdhC/CoxF family maturation factor